jgi:DNA-binding response OmpR family regulator
MGCVRAAGCVAGGIYWWMLRWFGAEIPMSAKKKRRVLVVDDDQMTADTITAIVRTQGFEAQTLYSGESAMEWIESFRPDVVLTDIRMRKVSGIETAVQVRELHPECRVILFSASELSAGDRQTMERLGFEFIGRPMHPTELVACLKA